MDSPIYHLEGVIKAKEEQKEDFTGPLDLILHLLSKNKMEIQDIQISLILEQYLDWMEQQKELDLDIASEFVTMASHLVYIKTKMLISIDQEEEVDELEQLIATLEAHKSNELYLKVKSVLEELGNRYRQGVNTLTKEPELLAPEQGYPYQHKKEELSHIMREILLRSERKLPPPLSAFQGIVGREVYPVADKTVQLYNQLLQQSQLSARALFQQAESRSEVVATFLAILELCRARRVILVDQEEDCILQRVEDTQEQKELSMDLSKWDEEGGD